MLIMINASQVHQTEMDIVHTSANYHGGSAMHKAKRQGQQPQCKHANAMSQACTTHMSTQRPFRFCNVNWNCMPVLAYHLALQHICASRSDKQHSL